MKSKRIRLICFILLVCFHTVSLIHFIIVNDYTFDEPLSIICGLEMIRNRDISLNPESGLLPQVVSALPYSGHQIPLPDAKVGRGIFTSRILFSTSLEEQGKIRVYTRFAMTVFSIGSLLLLFCVSCRITDSLWALLPAFLYVTCPVFTAHGPLANADMCSAFFFFAFVCSVFGMSRKLTFKTLFFACISICGVVLSKMSFPIAGIFFMVHGLFMIVSREKIRIELKAKKQFFVQTKWQKGIVILAVALVLFCSVLLILHLVYGQVRNFHPCIPLEQVSSASPLGRFLLKTGLYRIVPEPFFYGFSYINMLAQHRAPEWFDGMFLTDGKFFAFCKLLMLKIPLPTLLFAGIALIGYFLRCCRMKRIYLHTSYVPFYLFFLCFTGLYFLVWNITVQIRYFLPALLALFPLFNLCRFSSFSRTEQFRKYGIMIVLLLCAWNLSEYIASAPHQISYVSSVYGGKEKGYLYLDDSSFDWGQDLRNIDEILLSYGIPSDEPVYLRYQGFVPVNQPKPLGRQLILLHDWKGHDDIVFRPGCYLFSATALHHKSTILPNMDSKALAAGFLKLENLFRRWQRQPFDDGAGKIAGMLCFRKRIATALLGRYCSRRQPDFSINGSILCYRLTQQELTEALYASIRHICRDAAYGKQNR